MPTLITGQSGTDDILAVSQKIDIGTKVFGIDPPGNPYTRIMTKRLKSKPAISWKVQWQEDDIVPFWDQAASTVASGATSVDVDNGTYFAVGDLVKNTATDEVVRVTAISTNTLTITRGYAGTTAAAITTDDWLLNLRAAQAEGANSPTARATLKVSKENYTEIVKTPIHITNTARAVQYYHGDEERYQIRKAGEDHGRAWEERALHGHAANDTSTAAHPIRTAGGLDDVITSNILTVSGGTLTESEFRDWLGDCFRYRVNGTGGGSKVLIAGRALIHTINSWGQAKLQMNEKARATYGMDISTYIGSTGRVEVVYDPLLENGYEGVGYLIDPDGTMFRPLRNTKLEMNIQDPDEDGRKHQYITEATFQYALEQTFGLIEGVTF